MNMLILMFKSVDTLGGLIRALILWQRRSPTSHHRSFVRDI